MMVYRTLNMLKYGILPVFILECSTPKLKNSTLDKRFQCKYGTARKGIGNDAKYSELQKNVRLYDYYDLM